MKTSLRLATMLAPRDRFDAGVDLMLQMFTQMLPQIVMDEVAWLMKGDYEKQMERRSVVFEEIYTDEEMLCLIDFYEQNPWAVEKSAQVTAATIKTEQAWGEQVMQQAMMNLADRGEFESAMESMDEQISTLTGGGTEGEMLINDLMARDEAARQQNGSMGDE